MFSHPATIVRATKLMAGALVRASWMMMMMFIGTETLVTQLVYENSGMQADWTTRELEEMIK